MVGNRLKCSDRTWWIVFCAGALLGSTAQVIGEEDASAIVAVEPVMLSPDPLAEERPDEQPDDSETLDESLRVSRNVQPAAPLRPPLTQQPDVQLSAAGQRFSEQLTAGGASLPSGGIGVRNAARNGGTISVPGSESVGRASSDVGNLLGKSPNAVGIATQRRQPIINDPRIHGSRVGSLAASGSYWIPARIDLDTAVSKFDSRVIGSVAAIPGPFDVMNGPGFDFLIVDLDPSPRFANGRTLEGTTAFDFFNNGRRWHGRQEVRGGDETYGFDVGYSHRTGNDYNSGDGTDMPASYNSREFNATIGSQVGQDGQIDFHYLRLDQTGVELPGQAFDIDDLQTNGYEVEYSAVQQGWADRVVVEGWYNDTQLNGTTENPGKQREFPIYAILGVTGTTNVYAASGGYRAFLEWGDDTDTKWTAGTDLRDVRQELNEFVNGRLGGGAGPLVNSPIPHSSWIDPGVFLQREENITDDWRLTLGARTDIVQTNPRGNLNDLMNVGTQQLPYADIVGTNSFDQTFNLVSAFVNNSFKITDATTVDVSLGHGQRAPNLTELYAAESFMFLIQNGLNIVTGDPRLEKEKRWEGAVAMRVQEEKWRARARGFYAFVEDYITFESLGTFPPNNPNFDQVSLLYVNTNLATLGGADFLCEYDATEQLTPFATLQYVRGTDRTRNGNFATLEAVQGAPAQRVPGVSRGFFSGIMGGAQEALPGIAPLESRVGIRYHNRQDELPWTIEFSARIVDDQSRVATSLGERPTGGFTTFDLRGFWQVRKQLSLIGGVENLFDRNYREHLDFRSRPGGLNGGFTMLQPGISFYVGSVLDY